jgi:hypothetical protein
MAEAIKTSFADACTMFRRVAFTHRRRRNGINAQSNAMNMETWMREDGMTQGVGRGTVTNDETGRSGDRTF